MSTTALETLKLVAAEIGEFGEYVTTSSGAAPTASVASTLVCTTLVNSNLASTELEDTAVLIEDGNTAGEMRFVRRSGLTRTTGTLTMADNFTNQILTSVAFSTWSRLAPLPRLGERSLMACLNDGSRALSVRDIIAFTGVTNQLHYTVDTTTYPWWTEEWRVIAVEYPTTTSDEIPRDLPRSAWSWVGDGETKKLRFRIAPAQTGQTFNVRVYRPANSRLILNARLRAGISAGAVNSVTVVTGGYYSAVPTIAGSGGGGSGATFTAVLSGGTSGSITSVTIGAGGSGYTSPPALAITRNASDTGWRDQTTQTAKLIDISDETIADVGDAATACKAYAYQALATMHAEASEVEDWQKKSSVAFRSLRNLTNRRPSDPRTGIPNLRPTRVYTPPPRGRVWW